MFHIRNSTRADIEALATGPIRPLDKAEWESGLGKPVVPTFRGACYDPGVLALRTLLRDDEPTAIWGVTAANQPGMGSLWLLGKDVEYSREEMFAAFYAMWRGEVDLLHEKGGATLFALADQRNKLHHRWLKTMGFKVIGVEPGHDGSRFDLYARRHSSCADH